MTPTQPLIRAGGGAGGWAQFIPWEIATPVPAPLLEPYGVQERDRWLWPMPHHRSAAPLPPGLSPRTQWTLRRAGYCTAGQLRAAPDRELLSIPGLGRTMLAELRAQYPMEGPAVALRTCPTCHGTGLVS